MDSSRASVLFSFSVSSSSFSSLVFSSLITLLGSLYCFFGSRLYHRSSRPTMVLFPEPEAPTIAVVLPASKCMLRLSRTLTCGLLGYANVTESRLMSSRGETSGSLRPVISGFGASMTAKKSVAALEALEILIIGTAVWLMPKAIYNVYRLVNYQIMPLKRTRGDYGERSLKTKL